jgi:predicted nucleic acid-binding protein
VSVVHLDEEIATQAAVLRARHRSLKLSDALVIASAEHSSANRLITTDRKWPTAKVMKLTISIEQI